MYHTVVKSTVIDMHYVCPSKGKHNISLFEFLSFSSLIQMVQQLKQFKSWLQLYVEAFTILYFMWQEILRKNAHFRETLTYAKYRAFQEKKYKSVRIVIFWAYKNKFSLQFF